MRARGEVMVGTILLVLISILAVLGSSTWLGVAAYQHRHVDWQPVPGFAGAQFGVPNGVAPYSASRVSLALGVAVQALSTVPGWPSDKVNGVAKKLFILVEPTETWLDDWNRSVAGLSEETTIWTAYSLSTLGHELAHLCGDQIDGNRDDTHATWDARGISTAVLQYETWQKEQHWKADGGN